jgi:hypothetical protein
MSRHIGGRRQLSMESCVATARVAPNVKLRAAVFITMETLRGVISKNKEHRGTNVVIIM